VSLKYFLASRAPLDQRWDASVGAGGGHSGRSAREARLLDFDHRSSCKAYPSKGVELDTINKHGSRGERSGGQEARILDWPPPKKTYTEGFVKMSVPGTFEVGSPITLSHLTSHLVCTHHRQECLTRCAWVFETPPPLPGITLGNVNHKGRVRAVFYGLAGAGNNWQPTGAKQTRREERDTATNCGYGVLPTVTKGGGSQC
jgi:hypothetical protein